MRALWAALGVLALGLGMAGIVLPLLPTVPFLLLAAWCFARSSARLHGWLMQHPLLGPPIRDWDARGAVSRRAKIAASGSMLAVWVGSLLFGVPVFVLGLQAATLGCVAIFIWTRPD
ncbi:YbaN family protein [Cereibacter sp. SYSU M97828]|nr:YbaN family protein [Cereibacter flavus]